MGDPSDHRKGGTVRAQRLVAVVSVLGISIGWSTLVGATGDTAASEQVAEPEPDAAENAPLPESTTTVAPATTTPPTTPPPTTTTITPTTTTVPAVATTAPPPTTPASTVPVAPTTSVAPTDTTAPTTTTIPAPTTAPATTAPPTTAPASTASTTTAPPTTLPEPTPRETSAPDAADALPAEPTEVPIDDPGLRAPVYDGVYADGVPVGVAMATTRYLESRDDYAAQAPRSSASGAYQVIDSTWNGFGGFARAVDAPPDVQDQFAYESFVAILKRYGNDVSKIPLAWYLPSAIGDEIKMDIVPDVGSNVLTPREYQTLWLETFFELLGQGAPVFLPADTDPLIPAIAFPVLGPVRFYDDWHAERDGGARRHEGLDLIGVSGQPLRAAFNGVVTGIRYVDSGIAGVGITVTRDDGTYANYFHLNADTPGTNDNAADTGLRIHPGVDVGTEVQAGQIIGYMGDTGNAGIPHLHFEIRTIDREPMAPYPAILEAQQREQCSVGIGPWSTQFSSPTEIDAALAELSDERRASLAEIVPELPFEIDGPDGAHWSVAADGVVTATGIGALITPLNSGCTIIPDLEVPYGTNAAGLPVDLLPPEWWRDEVEEPDVTGTPDESDQPVDDTTNEPIDDQVLANHINRDAIQLVGHDPIEPVGPDPIEVAN